MANIPITLCMVRPKKVKASPYRHLRGHPNKKACDLTLTVRAHPPGFSSSPTTSPDHSTQGFSGIIALMYLEASEPVGVLLRAFATSRQAPAPSATWASIIRVPPIHIDLHNAQALNHWAYGVKHDWDDDWECQCGARCVEPTGNVTVHDACSLTNVDDFRIIMLLKNTH